MPSPYTVAKSKHGTLAPGATDRITLTSNPSKVAVTMRVPASGSVGLWVSTDGATDPTSAGDNADWVAPVAGAEIIIDLPNSDEVRVFSATADAYSVRAVV